MSRNFRYLKCFKVRFPIKYILPVKSQPGLGTRGSVQELGRNHLEKSKHILYFSYPGNQVHQHDDDDEP